VAELVNAAATNGTYGNAYYELMNDIDLSAYGAGFNGGKGWVPIGSTYWYPVKGNFDGNGKTISGLYIHNEESDHIGLFGCISNGTVKNLGVVDADVTGWRMVGGLTGRLTGGTATAQNSYVTGKVRGQGDTGV